jgi:5-methylcytosine-specific restriction enzyme A
MTPAQQGYDSAWQRIRAAVLRHYPYCVECGAKATDVDHVLPKTQGGSDDSTNLQPLCHACHSRKTARETGGWAKVGMAG